MSETMLLEGARSGIGFMSGYTMRRRRGQACVLGRVVPNRLRCSRHLSPFPQGEKHSSGAGGGSVICRVEDYQHRMELLARFARELRKGPPHPRTIHLGGCRQAIGPFHLPHPEKERQGMFVAHFKQKHVCRFRGFAPLGKSMRARFPCARTSHRVKSLQAARWDGDEQGGRKRRHTPLRLRSAGGTVSKPLVSNQRCFTENPFWIPASIHGAGGKKGTVRCAFPLFVACVRISTCRLRHFSEEKRDGLPTRYLSN